MHRMFDINNGVAIGDIPFNNEQYSNAGIEFIELINDVCDMSDVNGFSESNNESYTLLLTEIDKLLTQHSEMVNMLTDDNFKITPMHIAAGSGLFELVKVLAKHNPNLSLENCFEQTPAARARDYAKRPDIADYLDSLSLSHEADKSSGADAVRRACK